MSSRHLFLPVSFSMANVRKFCNFHEPLSTKGISNSEPVRWSKSMSTSQKWEEGKLAEVATGTPVKETSLYARVTVSHTNFCWARESQTPNVIPELLSCCGKQPKIQRVFLKCLSGHCYHPKRREVKLNSFFFWSSIPQGAISSPFSPLLPIMSPNWPDKVILQCSACRYNTAKWYFYLHWGGKAFQ